MLVSTVNLHPYCEVGGHRLLAALTKNKVLENISLHGVNLKPLKVKAVQVEHIGLTLR